MIWKIGLLQWIIIKKSENENTTKQYSYFIKSNFVELKRLFVLIYPKQSDRAKRFNGKKYYLPKGATKTQSVVGKNFYDQPMISLCYRMFVRLWIQHRLL